MYIYNVVYCVVVYNKHSVLNDCIFLIFSIRRYQLFFETIWRDQKISKKIAPPPKKKNEKRKVIQCLKHSLTARLETLQARVT
jgi:hypothetical protein